ncbi:MAG: hypothetical protein HQ492_05380 [Woeseiaceae bacterium]|nr:hypothetical protein [Woeseiaceae bacterium]
MTKEDEVLRVMLRESQRRADGSLPDFEVVFGAAERQLRDRRRIRFAGVAAGVGLAVLALSLLPTTEHEFSYVDMVELTATTQWSAPSDSLLPEHQFDVYRELPRLFESTDTM